MNEVSSGSSPLQPPRVQVCQMCHSTNARRFVFRRQVGMVFRRRVWTVDAILCRSCAQAIGRDCQSRTLTTGWWGTISVVVNAGYVLSNSLGLMRAMALEAPASRPESPTFPLDAGRPVLLRPFSWIGLLVVAAVACVAVLPESTSRSTPPSWYIGACVSGSTVVSPVSCSEPHNGWVFERASTAQGCRAYDGYVESAGWFYCINRTDS
mgnify:CR=1 FL=1